MSGIADEDNPPRPPGVVFEPLDAGTMDLLVGVQTGEIGLHQVTKVIEPASKAAQTAFDAVVLAIVANVRKSVGRSAADRTQSEEAPISQPKLHARRPVEFHRGDAAPRDLPGKRRADIAEDEAP